MLYIWRVITYFLLQLCLKAFICSETASMAAWGQPAVAGLPAEITEEKLQEKGYVAWLFQELIPWLNVHVQIHSPRF